MKKFKLLLEYSISIILIISYFVIMSISFSPSVSEEYSLFYLQHELKFMPPENGLCTKVGKNLYLDPSNKSDDVFWGLGSGWNYLYEMDSKEKGGYTFTGEGDNKLYFDGLDEKDYILTLYLFKTDADKICFETDNFHTEIDNLVEKTEISIVIPKENIIDNKVCINVTPVDSNMNQCHAYIDYVRLDK